VATETRKDKVIRNQELYLPNHLQHRPKGLSVLRLTHIPPRRPCNEIKVTYVRYTTFGVNIYTGKNVSVFSRRLNEWLMQMNLDIRVVVNTASAYEPIQKRVLPASFALRAISTTSITYSKHKFR
jgi:hypothetical protein